ncbi:hypothetical protein Misp04_24500 [Micromonospora sp. NBRC 101691]|nr:hypothetical protein Misp04_24500 [Micromonospora sp. NBRC 101691]
MRGGVGSCPALPVSLRCAVVTDGPVALTERGGWPAGSSDRGRVVTILAPCALPGSLRIRPAAVAGVRCAVLFRRVDSEPNSRSDIRPPRSSGEPFTNRIGIMVAKP